VSSRERTGTRWKEFIACAGALSVALDLVDALVEVIEPSENFRGELSKVKNWERFS